MRARLIVRAGALSVVTPTPSAVPVASSDATSRASWVQYAPYIGAGAGGLLLIVIVVVVIVCVVRSRSRRAASDESANMIELARANTPELGLSFAHGSSCHRVRVRPVTMQSVRDGSAVMTASQYQEVPRPPSATSTGNIYAPARAGGGNANVYAGGSWCCVA
jgi:hypothetical protein